MTATKTPKSESFDVEKNGSACSSHSFGAAASRLHHFIFILGGNRFKFLARKKTTLSSTFWQCLNTLKFK